MGTLARSGAAVVASVAFLIANPASSWAQEAVSPCPFSTQLELSGCSAALLSLADAGLEAVYARLLSQSDKEQGGRLRAAERAWVVYKEAMCKYSVAPFNGGSMEGMVLAQCLTDLTNAQSALLVATELCSLDPSAEECKSADEYTLSVRITSEASRGLEGQQVSPVIFYSLAQCRGAVFSATEASKDLPVNATFECAPREFD